MPETKEGAEVFQIVRGYTPSRSHNGGPGGPGGPSDMETRVAKLEALAESTDQRMSRVEDDLRSISSKMDSHFVTMTSKIDKQLYFTIGSLLAIAGLIAKSAGWI